LRVEVTSQLQAKAFHPALNNRLSISKMFHLYEWLTVKAKVANTNENTSHTIAFVV